VIVAEIFDDQDVAHAIHGRHDALCVARATVGA
jgi:hypothetical protein